MTEVALQLGLYVSVMKGKLPKSGVITSRCWLMDIYLSVSSEWSKLLMISDTVKGLPIWLTSKFCSFIEVNV